MLSQVDFVSRLRPGNGEAQTYTNDSENVKVEDGVLKITAIAGEGEAAVHYFDEMTLIDAGGTEQILEDFERYLPYFWLVSPVALSVNDLLKATTANAA